MPPKHREAVIRVTVSAPAGLTDADKQTFLDTVCKATTGAVPPDVARFPVQINTTRTEAVMMCQSLAKGGLDLVACGLPDPEDADAVTSAFGEGVGLGDLPDTTDVQGSLIVLDTDDQLTAISPATKDATVRARIININTRMMATYVGKITVVYAQTTPYQDRQITVKFSATSEGRPLNPPMTLAFPIKPGGSYAVASFELTASSTLALGTTLRPVNEIRLDAMDPDSYLEVARLSAYPRAEVERAIETSLQLPVHYPETAVVTHNVGYRQQRVVLAHALMAEYVRMQTSCQRIHELNFALECLNAAATPAVVPQAMNAAKNSFTEQLTTCKALIHSYVIRALQLRVLVGGGDTTTFDKLVEEGEALRVAVERALAKNRGDKDKEKEKEKEKNGKAK